MTMISNEATQRQKSLYEYLVGIFKEDPSRWVTQDEIMSSVIGFKSTNPKSHDKCPSIWSDINRINLCPDFDRIIVQDNFKYKLGNRDEAMVYMCDLTKKAMRGLMRASILRKKVDRDGQGIIGSDAFHDVFGEGE